MIWSTADAASADCLVLLVLSGRQLFSPTKRPTKKPANQTFSEETEFFGSINPCHCQNCQKPLMSVLAVWHGSKSDCKQVRTRYNQVMPATTGIRFGDLYNQSAQPRNAAFLCVSPLRASFYGWATVGRPSGRPVSLVAGSPTLSFACPPRLATGGGSSTTNQRGRIMRQIPARSEHHRPSFVSFAVPVHQAERA